MRNRFLFALPKCCPAETPLNLPALGVPSLAVIWSRPTRSPGCLFPARVSTKIAAQIFTWEIIVQIYYGGRSAALFVRGIVVFWAALVTGPALGASAAPT
jgi:hypothetical protein